MLAPKPHHLLVSEKINVRSHVINGNLVTRGQAAAISINVHLDTTKENNLLVLIHTCTSLNIFQSWINFPPIAVPI